MRRILGILLRYAMHARAHACVPSMHMYAWALGMPQHSACVLSMVSHLARLRRSAGRSHLLLIHHRLHRGSQATARSASAEQGRLATAPLP